MRPGETITRLLGNLGNRAKERSKLPYRLGIQRRESRVIRTITAILSRDEHPCTYDSEKGFEQLQQAYEPRGYKYDAYSTWHRGTERALRLLENAEWHKPGLKVLDAACGDGMTGHALASYGHAVTLNDIKDWRDDRAKELPFVCDNLCTNLTLDSDSFDLVCSYNASEHVEDPAAALAELVRVCKRGRHIYLEFGPLYASPWGLHAYRTIFMPYPQFLLSREFIETKLQTLGIHDLGQEQQSLQPLNQWRLGQFAQLWENCGCTIVSSATYTDHSHLELLARFPKAFSGRGLTFEDVTTTHCIVTLRKR